MANSVFLGGSGDVVGPGSATDSGFAQWDGTTGELLKNHAASVAIGSEVSGLGTGVATFLGTPTSANLASALTDETGSGAAVFANTPTLVTPVLGAATGTSVNLSGDCRAATYHVGATAGASGTGAAITAITVVNGIITSITVS